MGPWASWTSLLLTGWNLNCPSVVVQCVDHAPENPCKTEPSSPAGLDAWDLVPLLGMYRQLCVEFFQCSLLLFFLLSGISLSARASFPRQQAPLRAYFYLSLPCFPSRRARWVSLLFIFFTGALLILNPVGFQVGSRVGAAGKFNLKWWDGSNVHKGKKNSLFPTGKSCLLSATHFSIKAPPPLATPAHGTANTLSTLCLLLLLPPLGGRRLSQTSPSGAAHWEGIHSPCVHPSFLRSCLGASREEIADSRSLGQKSRADETALKLPVW